MGVFKNGSRRREEADFQSRWMPALFYGASVGALHVAGLG